MVEESKPARSIAGAIGMVFLCDACMIVGINVMLALMFGTYGSRGGLIPLAISIAFAVAWKSGRKSVGFFAVVSFAIGAVLVPVLGAIAQSM
jgi:hypothetical protein